MVAVVVAIMLACMVVSQGQVGTGKQETPSIINIVIPTQQFRPSPKSVG